MAASAAQRATNQKKEGKHKFTNDAEENRDDEDDRPFSQYHHFANQLQINHRPSICPHHRHHHRYHYRRQSPLEASSWFVSRALFFVLRLRLAAQVPKKAAMRSRVGGFLCVNVRTTPFCVVHHPVHRHQVCVRQATTILNNAIYESHGMRL